ncbi:MAG: tRNA (adenosine(37)-N6)-threonylcarbamoyltransferase complex ATPase subunit type 1 TsaE [Bacteroidales bacterium]|nr:tRNA (adenosine(37)-N6)-threonylcarbamoyltransferase complex ATPase subunit type 1 TsaE [Bacteroidales bacterium]
MELIATEQDLRQVAEAILQAHPDERVFGFFGEMGAGKTTLIKALCHVLDVQDNTSSPTFAIVNEYWTDHGEPVYHFDFYRIDEPREATNIGFEEYLASGCYCFIEWTEKVESILQGDYVPITIERTPESAQRRFIF